MATITTNDADTVASIREIANEVRDTSNKLGVTASDWGLAHQQDHCRQIHRLQVEVAELRQALSVLVSAIVAVDLANQEEKKEPVN